jgi:hypothetical protein
MQERLIYLMTTHTIVVIHCIPFINQFTQKNHSQNSYMNLTITNGPLFHLCLSIATRGPSPDWIIKRVVRVIRGFTVIIFRFFLAGANALV